MSDQVKDIWNDFRSELYRYINSKVKNEYDAEDILQDIFVKIHKNIDTVEDTSKLKPWIFKITKNTIIDYYRKNKNPIVDIEKLEDEFQEGKESDNMNEEISKCLEIMVTELPEKYQKAIELHDIKGMKYKDISEKLDVSISCSKMREQRAKEKLKNILFECCDFELDAFGNVINYEQRNKVCKRNCK